MTWKQNGPILKEKGNRDVNKKISATEKKASYKKQRK